MRTKIIFFFFTVILLMQCSESEFLSEYEDILGEWDITHIEEYTKNNQKYSPSQLKESRGEFKRDRSLTLTPDPNGKDIRFWNIIEDDTKMVISSKRSNSIPSQEINFFAEIYNIQHLSSDSIFINSMHMRLSDSVYTTKEWIFTR